VILRWCKTLQDCYLVTFSQSFSFYHNSYCVHCIIIGSYHCHLVTNRMMYMMRGRFFYFFHFFSENISTLKRVYTAYRKLPLPFNKWASVLYHNSYTCNAGYSSLRHAYTAHRKLLPLLSTHCHSSYQEDTSNLCLKHGFPFLNLYHYTQEIG